MSKVEGGGGAIDSPSCVRVTIFSSRLLGLKYIEADLLHVYSLDLTFFLA